MRRHRASILGPACSPGPYASFECIGRSPLHLLYELCSLLTGTASGSRNSKTRRHRASILGPACSTGPYASFECIGRSPPHLLHELCTLLTGTASGRRNS